MRLGTYKGIHMTRPNTEVTKHEVLNVLKKKQKEYAVATNIDDRSAQEGDQVILDFLRHVSWTGHPAWKRF